jgi:hypothetical protein
MKEGLGNWRKFQDMYLENQKHEKTGYLLTSGKAKGVNGKEE